MFDDMNRGFFDLAEIQSKIATASCAPFSAGSTRFLR
jgi:hypothetical protein